MQPLNWDTARVMIDLPLLVPDVGPGEETTARYVGGGGGGGVLRLPWLASLGEVTVSPLSSLGYEAFVFLKCSS